MPDPRLAALSPRRILIVRLTALGDVIRGLPLLPPLKARFPSTPIDWMCESAAKDVLGPQPLVDQVLVFPRRQLGKALAGLQWWRATRDMFAIARRLRASGYDLVLDPQATYKSSLISRATRAPTRLSYDAGGAKEYLPGAATVKVGVPDRPISRVDKALLLLEPVGADPGLASAALPVNQTLAAGAHQGWTEAGTGARILLNPGTSTRQSHKRWPAARFAQLATTLAGTGHTVRVAWGPGEEELARQVAHGAGAGDLLMPPTSVGALAEWIRAADLFVGNDSGPMHLSWLVGTRVVALYGPTDPVVNSPWGDGHVTVVAPVAAGRKRSRLSAPMERLDVDEVLAACCRALAGAVAMVR